MGFPSTVLALRFQRLRNHPARFNLTHIYFQTGAYTTKTVVNFVIVDCPSTYNLLIGRPAIDLDAIFAYQYIHLTTDHVSVQFPVTKTFLRALENKTAIVSENVSRREHRSNFRLSGDVSQVGVGLFPPILP